MTTLLLVYRDLPRARDFLVSALGFTEEYSNTGSDGALIRSHVRLDDTTLLLSSPGAHSVKSPQDVGGITHLIVVTVDDVDSQFARAVSGGAEVVERPADRPWGRDCEVRDPEGYTFNFIT
jgi:PhnB protein